MKRDTKRTTAPIFLVLASLLATSTAIAYFQNMQDIAASLQVDQEMVWVCPMHPDYTKDTGGMCPRCGMQLVRGTPYDVRDYPFEFTTNPYPPRVGEPTTLTFRMRRPDTGELIHNFEMVHMKKFHLFVISQDMEWFQHIHPEMAPDGTWTIEVTLPKPGYYKVLSDLMPQAGASQFIARGMVTANYNGDLMGDSAHLIPDTNLTKSDGDLTATLSYDPPNFEVAQYGHLNYHLTDTATGRAVNDIQTYLGAFGHTLIMSEDMGDYVHSHPFDILALQTEEGETPQFLIPPGSDLEAIHGGPDITFEGLMPRPGRYRAWTQFRRNDEVHTFALTFEVKPQTGPLVIP